MKAPTASTGNIPPQAPPGEADVRLFLRVPPPAAAGRSPARLARLLGLDLYSGVLLGKRARSEMSFAAVLLLLVASFELLAWSFTFNALWNGDVLYLGPGTAVAALVGALFASSVLWFERQFLVSDEPPERRRAAAAARLLFVLFAAFINAQSLELLVFRAPIDQRALDEQVRARAAVDLAEVERQERADAGESKAALERLGDAGKTVQTQLDGERARLQTARVDGAAAALALRGARAELRQLEQQASADPAAAVTSAPHRESLRREIERASGARAYSDAQVPVSTDEVTRLDNEQKANASAVAVLARDRAAASDQRRAVFVEWVDRLAHTTVGQSANGAELPSVVNAAVRPEVVEQAKRWHYEYRRPNAFEQLRIPWDLALAHPPRWLAGSPALVQELETTYGLHVPRPCLNGFGDAPAPGALPCDPLGWETEVTRSHIFLVTLISCHLLAVFIPLLVLVIKTFLLPQELRRYYSARHQAAAGDADALQAVIVDQRAGTRP